MLFPDYRPRRLRKNECLRRLVRETTLTVDDFIMPFFVVEGKGIKREIKAMPGIFQFSVDLLIPEVKNVKKAGIPGIILFGIPDKKNELGTGAYAKDGIVQRAVKEIKHKVPDILVITDVCLCEYTNHGHCGMIYKKDVDNDATLDLLARTAVSHVMAGADMVAPSDMMDGRVGEIRGALDENEFTHIPIMSYAAKYSSAFYGPFREAAESAPQFGDRKSYQMDPPNALEALREVQLDIDEGADILMIKPALPYLDIIKMVREEISHPVAAFNVSGEYAMIKAAAQNGWIDEKSVMMETLMSIKRAGADIIITYFALDAARVIMEGRGM